VRSTRVRVCAVCASIYNLYACFIAVRRVNFRAYSFIWFTLHTDKFRIHPASYLRFSATTRSVAAICAYKLRIPHIPYLRKLCIQLTTSAFRIINFYIFAIFQFTHSSCSFRIFNLRTILRIFNLRITLRIFTLRIAIRI
jgi:hypothetical protein